MGLLNNPWVGVLSRPQGKTTDGIIDYFAEQGKNLSDASGGKMTGVFAQTSQVNDALSTTYDISGAVEAVANLATAANLAAIQKLPELDLRNADDMYEEHDYCFEIRSDSYRFRLFELRFGPLYPATMRVDDGVYNDLAKSSDRFVLTKEGKPRLLTIRDDNDLNNVFLSLLKSKKLNYICNRLMVEGKREARS